MRSSSRIGGRTWRGGRRDVITAAELAEIRANADRFEDSERIYREGLRVAANEYLEKALGLLEEYFGEGVPAGPLLYALGELHRIGWVPPILCGLGRDGDYEPRLHDLRSMPYDDYLMSPEWREVRKVALARAGGRCQGCNTDQRLNVHHRTYDRRGEEALDDLTVLCSTCHARIHDKAPR